MNDKDFMLEAYNEALAAGDRGECPVGSVIVMGGHIIARAGNEEIALNDPTAHAEILCMRRAGKVLKQHVLAGCTMYTTLWPCPMCETAMLQAQIDRVVSGARSFNWIKNTRFNHSNLVKEGPILEHECRELFIEWAQRNQRFEILGDEE
jgi:tRNA(adenine34) deaminase